MEEDRKPNWKKWRLFPDVQAWQAAALSLDIDPNKIRFDKEHWSIEQPVFAESQEYADRIEVISANIGGVLPSCGRSFAHPFTRRTSLAAFAVWAESIDWEIPSELKALAKASKPAPTPPEPPQDKIPSAKGRNAYLRTINALVSALINNRTGKPDSDAHAVLAALQLAGVPEPVNHRTLSRYLSDADKLLD